ncbi:MAG TPA: SDR family NAD(P)-dependent oxidoreductase, partial [Paracoccaceae bacterium]|nr:SDR family NAD(P)-dependent oxidoreductase [Paracoccaceae bacterium]
SAMPAEPAMGAFRDQVVLISGAASGFGALAAERFGAEGARLILSDRDVAGLEGIAGRVQAAGVEAVAEPADVTDPDSAGRLVALALARHGRLDIAVNNAGIVNAPARLPEISRAEARAVIEVDLLGLFWALQAQLPQMERQFRETGRGGAIVNIASVAGLVGSPTLSIYAAAKHGVVGLTRSAAMEYARRGVRVNAICPAYARTPMVEAILGRAADPAAAEAEMVRGVPMRRLAEPTEVVQAILWAAQPGNSFMTGQAIAIDGGITGY